MAVALDVRPVVRGRTHPASNGTPMGYAAITPNQGTEGGGGYPMTSRAASRNVR